MIDRELTTIPLPVINVPGHTQMTSALRGGD